MHLHAEGHRSLTLPVEGGTKQGRAACVTRGLSVPGGLRMFWLGAAKMSNSERHYMSRAMNIARLYNCIVIIFGHLSLALSWLKCRHGSGACLECQA